MKKFDVIVIGGGSGLTISSWASDNKLKTAIIEQGPLGGTCLNRGCIPSKMLIHSAEVAETIKNAEKFGINVKGYTVNFPKIVKRVFGIIDPEAKEIEEAIKKDKFSTLYKATAKFVGHKKIQVGKEIITADKIFIFAGTRPSVPPIPGLDKVEVLTSKEVLRLKSLPKSMTIIGGGYIAAELAHFFGSLGTKITIIQRNDVMIPAEDREISQVFTKQFAKKYKVLLNHNAVKVEKNGANITVVAQNAKTGKKTRISSEKLLLAVGRRPNSDILDVKKTGVEVNKFGYINTNDYLETDVKGIYAGGDIAGKWLFKHSANLEADYLVHNAFNPKHKVKVDYTAMPHAVFSSPQIAGVGLTEAKLQETKYHFTEGKYYYKHTGMGEALQEKEGFVKFYADFKTGKILGCFIIGPNASTLIHEVLIAMKSGSGKISDITSTVHIHPALNEVVQRAAARVKLEHHR